MSELYETIPEERRYAFLANAKKEFNEAVAPLFDPVIKELGALVVQDAERIRVRSDAVTEIMIEALPTVPEDSDTPFADDVERYVAIADVVAEHRKRAQQADRFELAGSSFGEVLKEIRKPSPRNLNTEFARKYEEAAVAGESDQEK